MFEYTRDNTRQFFFDSWHKYQEKKPLQPLEQQVCDIISIHPEYHPMLAKQQIEKDYLPEAGETNPFLHMGLHLGLREHIATNRPNGIQTIYQTLAPKMASLHDLEHQMIECLAEALWQSQQYGTPLNEQAYLNCLQQLQYTSSMK